MKISQSFRPSDKPNEVKKEEDPDTILSRAVLLAAVRRSSKPANNVPTMGTK